MEVIAQMFQNNHLNLDITRKSNLLIDLQEKVLDYSIIKVISF